MRQKNMSKKYKWIPFPRTEAGIRLINPYCGLFSLYRFYIGEERGELQEEKIENTVVQREHSICLVEINLLYYNDKPLSKKALDDIKRIFDFYVILKKQMIVRFLYDWEGKGILSEPKDITIILNHMSQLSSLLKEYTNYIYILQGLFIGSWGEMHNSRYLHEKHIVTLAKHLYECSGSSTQIALRCPSYWRMLFRTHHPIEEEDVFLEIQKARFSLFNDGIMASETDYGTYGEGRAAHSKVYGEKWIRQEELNFQESLCLYVSNGGEVVHNCSFNDSVLAIETLRKMRVSYLHCDYDKEVLNKWKASNSGILNSTWKNKSAYEYIAAHLGYRFTIETVKVFDSDDRKNLNIKIYICNTGFSPCYRRFNVICLLRDTSYSKEYEYYPDADTRLWFPNKQVDLNVTIEKDEISTGKYIFCLKVWDTSLEQSIQLANTFAVMDHKGFYHLGSLIKKN